MHRIVRLVGALALWLLAIAGAIAVAMWLRLPTTETRALVLLIAFVAFFGAFLPVLRAPHPPDL